MSTSPEQKHAATSAADRLSRAHSSLVAAAASARAAKLPRVARIDKLAAQATDLRDYYVQLAAKV